jgi:hypothetical protein
MTTISATDLTSELVDLTTVPLRALRTTTTPQLMDAIRQMIAISAMSSNEIQEQNG